MKNQNKSRLTILKWTLFTSIGWIIGLTIAVLSADILEKVHLHIFALGFGISLGIGSFQWIVLSKYIENSWRWMLFTILGLGGVFLLLSIIQVIFQYFKIELIPDGVGFFIPILICAILGGYIIGRLQEKYILRKIAGNSSPWVKVSMLGWFWASLFLSSGSIGLYYLSTYLQLEKDAIGPLPSLIIFIGFGPILGIVTGKKLIAIVSH